jgi:hypothetical protein
MARVGREETRKQSDYLVDLDADGRIVLESFLKQSFGMTKNGFTWLRILKSGELFLTLQWTIRFYKIRGISSLPEELLVSKE